MARNAEEIIITQVGTERADSVFTGIYKLLRGRHGYSLEGGHIADAGAEATTDTDWSTRVNAADAQTCAAAYQAMCALLCQAMRTEDVRIITRHGRKRPIPTHRFAVLLYRGARVVTQYNPCVQTISITRDT